MSLRAASQGQSRITISSGVFGGLQAHEVGLDSLGIQSRVTGILRNQGPDHFRLDMDRCRKALSTFQGPDLDLQVRIVPTSSMPKGVEHSRSLGITLTGERVPTSSMPKVVEHAVRPL